MIHYLLFTNLTHFKINYTMHNFFYRKDGWQVFTRNIFVMNNKSKNKNKKLFDRSYRLWHSSFLFKKYFRLCIYIYRSIVSENPYK